MNRNETIRLNQQNTLGWIHWYVEQGFHVFPVQPCSKIPHPGMRWKEMASNDINAVISMFDLYPESNIAIRTGSESNLTVIDLDLKNEQQRAAEGWYYYERIIDTVVRNSKGFLFEVRTPGNGKHLYLEYIEGFPTTHGVLGNIDIQNDNAYVLAPPSVLLTSLAGEPYLLRSPR
jgi:hypothetical protein